MGNALLGVVFHWLGGLASGSFYVPYKGVKKWSWETYWLVGGFFSWIICPILLASILTTDVFSVLRQAPSSTLWWAYFFGAMWGFGGLTFGLTMRYLGMSLGMGVALGYCAAFGTLVPPIFKGEFASIISTHPGQVTLIGVVVCILGIVVAAYAGLTKERQMNEADKKKAIAEFSFTKGILVATFSGIMSACFAFGLAAGKPIEDLTYCGDIARSTAAAGKTISQPSLIEDAAAASLVKSLTDATFFKDAKKEIQEHPTLAAVVEMLEAPITLQLALDGLTAQGGNADKVAIEKKTAELRAAIDAQPAQLATLKQVGGPVAERIQLYLAGLSTLRGKTEDLGIIAGLKDLPRKEVAVASVAAGADFVSIHKKHQLWTGLPVLIIVLLGGFTTNFLWCLMLNIKNRTGYQYFASHVRPEHAGLAASGGEHGGGAAVAATSSDLKVPRFGNFFFSALAGTTWYFQFFFYTMGATQMGKYDFASWTLHMASIIIFSTMWGWIFHEWKGSSKKAHTLIATGIATLILSTIIIGFGTWLKGQGGL
jgi:hypothetical protein